MTGEQYVRANKRVYNVVIILLAVMTILSVMACLAEFKITILLQTAAAVAGIIVVNTYAKKVLEFKKGWGNPAWNRKCCILCISFTESE